MTRRYNDVEAKPATALRPGDQIVTRRTITQVTTSHTQVVLTFDDGGELVLDLAGDPAVEVVSGAEDGS